jgi:hypothetical protein
VTIIITENINAILKFQGKCTLVENAIAVIIIVVFARIINACIV